jgi:hypothetical protein
MSPERVLTAREAYTDCLQFWNKTVQPTLKHQQRATKTPDVVFKGELTPEDEFKISVRAPHSAVALLSSRYPAADFEFDIQREPIPGTSVKSREEYPLHSLYAEFTIDFTPYGTILPGSNDDNDGNSTQADAEDEADNQVVEPITVDTVPSGPSLDGASNEMSPASPSLV